MSIAFVGDYFNEYDEEKGAPFSGPAGSVLRGCLRQVGIDPKECLFTSVFNQRPAGGRVEYFLGSKAGAIPNFRAIENNQFVQAEYYEELVRLYRELAAFRPNVVVAFGNTALWALTKKVGIKAYRGSALESFDIAAQLSDHIIPYTGPEKFKVLPAWPPATVIRQWDLRPILLADMDKAKRQSSTPVLTRPSHLLYMEPSLQDIEDFYEEFLVGQPFLSCDIETKAKTITEVGFSLADSSRALIIPFWDRKQADGNYWRTSEDEAAAWRWVARICDEFPLIGQNFQYDMKYLWRTVGIPCPKYLDDTMLMHHSLQPEMQKGLGFLASIYTDEPSWKFMRTTHDTLKKEDL